MRKATDLTGNKYHSLRVLRQVPSKSKASAYWECVCDCGTVKVIGGGKLKSGRTKSCGCHRKKILNQLTHGMSNKTTTYKSWKEMRWRCNPKNAEKQRWYAGVKVCERWDDFANFLTDMGERPEGMSIDRIDPFGNYEPSNCRWATQKEQMNNQRRQYAA